MTKNIINPTTRTATDDAMLLSLDPLAVALPPQMKLCLLIASGVLADELPQVVHEDEEGEVDI